MTAGSNLGFPRTTIGAWQKYWSLIEKTDTCWLWVGRRLGGYGSIYMLGKRQAPHRLMMFWVGKLANLEHRGSRDSGLVLHKCDNKLCVNPDHLYIGSHRQNIKDAWDRGQLKRRSGEASPCSKLTNDQAAEIRRQANTRKRSELAIEFGVSVSTIDLVINNKRYPEKA